MNYRLLSVAEDDLATAARFYERQAAGLGHDFLNEFESTMARILQLPEAWRSISANHRRCLFRRFPFAVLYSIDSDGIIVSGVLDLRMNPAQQKQRLSET